MFVCDVCGCKVGRGKEERHLCTACFCSEEPGSQQEGTMEHSVKGEVRWAWGGSAKEYDRTRARELHAYLSDGKGGEVRLSGEMWLTWPAPREPHTCPGLEERNYVVKRADADGWWDVHNSVTGDIPHYSIRFCPYCGHDLNKPDSPGAG